MDDNETWTAYIEDQRKAEDDLGALYYVVAVILIYGLSIVMMIASHIRKNKQDNQLRTYLKEMAKLRKDDRRDKVLSKIHDIANRHQKQDTKIKLQERLKDVAVDSEADNEACQPLMTRETNEDTNDSVFLQPDCCVTEEQHSPSTSECFHTPESGRVRSLSFHDNGSRKSNVCRYNSIQDNKTMRTHGRSPNCNDQRLVVAPLEARSPSLSDFHLSPLFSRERFSTAQEASSFNRWNQPRTPSPIDIKFHTISETNHLSKTDEKTQ